MPARYRLVVCALAVGLAGVPATDSQEGPTEPLPTEALALPAQSGMLIRVDVRSFFGSVEYELLSGERPGTAGLPDQQKAEIKDGIAELLREIEDKTGINPARDVDLLVAGIAGFEEKHPRLAVILIGRFESARVLAALEASARYSSAVASKVLHGQSLLVVSKVGRPAVATVVIDGRCVIVGTPEVVESTLASWALGNRPLTTNTALMNLVKGMDSPPGLWLALDSSATAALRKQVGPEPPPFPIPSTVRMAVRRGGSELVAEMADEGTASTAADILRGWVAAARMQAAQRPEMIEASPAGFLETLQVAAQGSRVVLSAIEADSGPADIGTLGVMVLPSLRRALVSTNEAATLRDLRTLLSAEGAYELVGLGYADLACLTEPSSCIEGYSGPAFLDKTMVDSRQRSGYERAFHPGPAGRKPSTITAFAYTATPLEPGKTGVRSFCADSTGRMCFDATGATIVPSDGACPATCGALPNFATLWRRGKISEAIELWGQQHEYYQGEKGVLFGQILRDDGQPLSEADKYDIGIEPGIFFFGDYWSPDGYFLFPVEPGTYRMDIHGSRWLADTSPVQVAPRRLVDVGTITLRRRDLSSLPRTKVRLNVRRASGSDKNLDAGGIRVRADMQDDNSFLAVTADDGTAEIDIPRLPGSWRVTSQERGYAQVWHSFFVEPESESVDLGRFEITRLKQVTIRWATPKEPGSNRFAGDEVGGATTVLKAYGRCWAEGGSSEFTFAFATKRPECGGRSDLQLIQSGEGEVLVETEPGFRSTTLLEFFPGTFALGLPESDQAALCDLGEVALESVETIPLARLRSLTKRGAGLPVVVGHTYGLRSFDGKRYVLVHVEKIEDQPLDRTR